MYFVWFCSSMTTAFKPRLQSFGTFFKNRCTITKTTGFDNRLQAGWRKPELRSGIYAQSNPIYSLDG